jgi:hypothetical protein
MAPVTKEPHMPDTVTTLPLAHSFDGATFRRPALLGFLVRCSLATPADTGLRITIEFCRAELKWSVADWKRLNPHFNGWDHEAGDQSERCRLPHEKAAAHVLNIWGHIVGPRVRIAELLSIAKDRKSRGDDRLADAMTDLSYYLAARRKAWALLIPAIKAYRAARAAIDAPTGAPCQQRIAA